MPGGAISCTNFFAIDELYLHICNHYTSGIDDLSVSNEKGYASIAPEPFVPGGDFGEKTLLDMALAPGRRYRNSGSAAPAGSTGAARRWKAEVHELGQSCDENRNEYQ